MLKKNIYELINIDIINFYTTPGELINLINLSEDKKFNLLNYNLKTLLNLLIDNGYYKKNKIVKNMMFNFIELFFLKEYKSSNTKKSLLSFYHSYLDKINNAEKFNLDEESLFLEFKSKLLNG